MARTPSSRNRVGGGGPFFAYNSNGNAIAVPITAVGGGGNGGAVNVVSTAPITTSGVDADGIVAQSVGGGGGLVGTGFYQASLGGYPFAGTTGAAGQGGAVNVTVGTPVMTPGLGSTAIFADSDGGSGSGNIAVDIAAVEILGGAGNGHAVSLLGGANNVITNAGALLTWTGSPAPRSPAVPAMTMSSIAVLCWVRSISTAAPTPSTTSPAASSVRVPSSISPRPVC